MTRDRNTAGLPAPVLFPNGPESRQVCINLITPLCCVVSTLQYCHGHFITISDCPTFISLLFYSINMLMFVVELQEIKSPVVFTLVLVYCLILASSIVSNFVQHLPTFLSPIGKLSKISHLATSVEKNCLPHISSLIIVTHFPSLLIITNHFYTHFLQVVGETLEGTFTPLALLGSC
jgi:hypothetical protein